MLTVLSQTTNAALRGKGEPAGEDTKTLAAPKPYTPLASAPAHACPRHSLRYLTVHRRHCITAAPPHRPHSKVTVRPDLARPTVLQWPAPKPPAGTAALLLLPAPSRCSSQGLPCNPTQQLVAQAPAKRSLHPAPPYAQNPMQGLSHNAAAVRQGTARLTRAHSTPLKQVRGG